jgi:UDP:flavonoid glycosyltransferase YjiC (YdhE family)
MYANTAKIYFSIKGKRENFFKNRVLQFPAHPKHPYEPKKKNNRKNKNRNRNKKPQQMESVRMIMQSIESMIVSSSPPT